MIQKAVCIKNCRTSTKFPPYIYAKKLRIYNFERNGDQFILHDETYLHDKSLPKANLGEYEFTEHFVVIDKKLLAKET